MQKPVQISRSPHEQEARTAHHFEEYDAGLDRVGPQYEEEDAAEHEAMVRAAGVTAYYDADGK